ncbi:hypothetical protein TIFTF001_021565 [Ficus carica]|uniref:Transmembrane protein n=1 Tax=Ficus carica TaxID=3494 RepID=A0AA88DAV8_FICCA|nr:hypothetical protein TIFTF001_021565 [Ficus carica]
MAAPSNKSSSSPIPGRANPSPRSSEIGNPMRRSFTGNPFSKPSIIPNPRGLNPNTPANSPSELPRRNSSVSRESVVTLRDSEDNKENGKMAKLRSPMGSKGSGTKNFMSPTISAASKINASPRKRILEERNEQVRASVSVSDVKIASFSPAISDSSDHKKEEEEEILAAPPVSAESEAISDSKAKKVVFVESELDNLEPTFKISPPPPPLCSSSPSIPVIAPLDSDPLAPPYDPKTNYLSPRPRFLHYKPNPRVELYLSKSKEGKRLEDSFASRSFSDSDITDDEEEIYSESLPKESEEDISSGEDVRAEDKQEDDEEEELLVSEPSPIDAMISKETVEAKTEFKPPRSVWRSKLTALLIILSVLCVSISVANLPVIDHSVFDGIPAFLKQYDQPEILEFAKASLDEIAQRFPVWYANSISSLSKLISNLREAHKVEPLHYFNLSALVEDDFEMNVFVPTREKREFHIGADKALQIDAEYQEQVHQKADEASSEVEEETPEIHFSTDLVEAGQVPSAELVEPESSIAEKSQEENDPIPISQADEARSEVFEAEVPQEVGVSSGAEMEAQVSEAEMPQEEVDVSSGAEMEAAKDYLFSSETPEAGVTVDESREDSFSKVNVLGMAFLVLALIASTGFFFVKKGSNNSTLNSFDVSIKGQGLVNKKLDSSPTLNKPGNTFEVRDFSGESCPSEMSSYRNTSYNNNKKGLNSRNEAQSYERKTKKNQRRESMASSSMDSSMGSPSYGSFTTYEKIPVKYGQGDDEVITPVRRSSRLRSYVTSS